MKKRKKGKICRNTCLFFGAALLLFSNMDQEMVQAEGEGQLSAYEREVDEPSGEEDQAEYQVSEAVQNFADAMDAFSLESREDIKKLLAIAGQYDRLSSAEKATLPKESIQALEEAKEAAGKLNCTDNGVTVTGNLPWYVQFRAKEIPETEGNKVDEDVWVIAPYEMELWDLTTDSAYVLPEGESVKITMPIPDTIYQGNFVIYHYKSDGTVEKIVPEINGDTMSFTATSFSNYTVAGSTLLAGIGVTTDFHFPSPESETTAEKGQPSDTENVLMTEASSDTGEQTTSPETERFEQPQRDGSGISAANGETVVSPAQTADKVRVWPLILAELFSALILAGAIMKKKQIQE